jgi:hypothetical protein
MPSPPVIQKQRKSIEQRIEHALFARKKEKKRKERAPTPPMFLFDDDQEKRESVSPSLQPPRFLLAPPDLDREFPSPPLLNFGPG